MPQQSVPQSATTPTSSVPETQGEQETEPSQTPPAEAQPSTLACEPRQKPPPGAGDTRRKISPGCVVAPTAPGSGAAGTTASEPPADSSATSQTAAGQTPGTAPVPKPCPPPKTIVRHGGSAEPSIQLGGGPNNAQASHQRDAANQLLGSTEANLKKIAGQQLSSNQKGNRHADSPVRGSIEGRGGGR